MPPPPPVAMPTAPEFAGTLPASSAMLQELAVGLPTRRSSRPPASDAGPVLDRTQPTASRATMDRTLRTNQPPPPEAPAPRAPLGATQVRTLDTGRPPAPAPAEPLRTPSYAPSANVPTLDHLPPLTTTPKTEDDLPRRTGSRTVVDATPAPITSSRSTVRAPRPLGAFLVSYQYEPLGTYWPLGLGSNVIGRSGGGRPDLDVGIGDTTVSSEQAVVEIDTPNRPGGPLVAVLEDRGSRNGTAVNGRPVTAFARVPIAHGDHIRFGSFETVLVLVPYPAAS